MKGEIIPIAELRQIIRSSLNARMLLINAIHSTGSWQNVRVALEHITTVQQIAESLLRYLNADETQTATATAAKTAGNTYL